MNKRQMVQIIIVITGLSGYGILLSYNWKIALGVFLVHWSINADILSRRE